MSKRRDQIKRRWEAALDRACDRAQDAFEAEVSRTVAGWDKRFPRHQFRAAVGHGMLIVECTPPFRGEKNPEWWRCDRGAAGVIVAEVQELADWHCSLDRRASTGGDCDWIDGKEAKA